ncbi:unnamed protein product [Ectocarpus sp. CCAP 1310/34]|nr:unnamed protein product [Ectocarpus sp. CCAP 1310/34]
MREFLHKSKASGLQAGSMEPVVLPRRSS